MPKLNSTLTRRDLLRSAAPSLLGLASWSRPARAGAGSSLPPVRAITRGPEHHWFGYYDKLEFDPTGRFVLGMEVDFEHRSPTPADVIRIGMVDLQDGDKWIELGESRAWCWQQGCMLQWRPGSRTEVLWNDRERDRFVCRILDIETRQRRTVPHPVYTVSPDGGWAVAPDFRRVGDMRPAYGYPGPVDPYREVGAPEDSGIFRVDLDTGRQELLISVDQVVRIPMPGVDLAKAKSYFNFYSPPEYTREGRVDTHPRFSPDGRKVVIDSPHTGQGRQMHLIDIGEIVSG